MMKQIMTLVKREYWEHRKTFLVLPLVVTGLCIFFLVTGVGTMALWGDEVQVTGKTSMQNDQSSEVREYESVPVQQIFGQKVAEFASFSRADKEQRLNTVYRMASVPLFSVLWLVVTLYFVNCLIDERKDRSILFWKSMPVSDLATVVSKLIAALVLVPLIYLVCIMVVQSIVLIVSVISGLGQDISVWDTFIAPANVVSRWFATFGYMVFLVLWCLPFYAWLMLVSAWAKSIPTAWIIGVPIVVVIMEKMVSSGSSDVVSGFIWRHVIPIGLVSGLEGSMGELLSMLVSVEFIISTALALAMLYGAVVLRGKADEL